MSASRRIPRDVAFMVVFILAAALIAAATGIQFIAVFAAMLLIWLPFPLWQMAKGRRGP